MSKKSFTLKKQSSVDKKISMFAMVSIALLAIFNLQNVMDNYVGLGLSASVAFVIAVIVFMVPFIFIIAEFASLVKGTKSGLTSWIQTAVGRKIAFLTSFMFWFANLTYFFSAVPSRINYLSFAVTGQNYTEDALYNQIVPWASVVFFLIITFISTLNTKKISRITSLGGGLMLGLTAFFFLFSIFGWIGGAINPNLLDTTQAPGIAPVPGTGDNPLEDPVLNYWGESGGLGFGWISTFIWVLMAADGGQSLGVYVNDVKGGKKTFVRSMMISVGVIGFAYVLGTLLVSVFPPTGGLGAGWANSFYQLFYFVMHPMGASTDFIRQFSFILIGLIFFISSVGGIIIWTSAPVKVMFSEIAPGIFGQRLSRENRNGVCSFGAWMQFLIVVPLLLFLMLSKGDLSSSLSLIKGAAGWIGMLPWLVIFCSYINLRTKRDYEQRGFKMGPRWFGIIIGWILAILTTVILVLTIMDTAPLEKPFNEWPSDWYLGLVLKVVMIVIILVPAYLWYYFKFEFQIRDSKIAKVLNVSDKVIFNKYNFSSKKNIYLYTDNIQKYNIDKNRILFKHQKLIFDLEDQIFEQTKYLNVSSSKEETKSINHVIKNLKAKIKETEKAMKFQLKELKRAHKNEIKNLVINNKMEYRAIYESTVKNYVQNLKKSSPAEYKQMIVGQIPTWIEKDIEFDDINQDKFFSKHAMHYKIAYHYSSLAKKVYQDKLVFDGDKLFVIKDNADSLVGTSYALDKLSCLIYSKDKSIKVISDGKWIDLDLVEFIYVEEAQLITFKVYLKESRDVYAILNNNKLINLEDNQINDFNLDFHMINAKTI